MCIRGRARRGHDLSGPTDAELDNGFADSVPLAARGGGAEPLLEQVDRTLPSLGRQVSIARRDVGAGVAEQRGYLVERDTCLLYTSPSPRDS